MFLETFLNENFLYERVWVIVRWILLTLQSQYVLLECSSTTLKKKDNISPAYDPILHYKHILCTEFGLFLMCYKQRPEP